MTRIGDPNSWYSEHAIRLLADRAATDPAATRAAAASLGDCADRSDTFRLRYLWAQFAAGGGALAASTVTAGLDDPAPAVRGWTIRLLCETPGPVAPATLARFVALAKSDPSPVVRLELASACQRLPLADRWPIVAALIAHDEDNADPNLPLMNWYAFEPLAALDPARALKLARESKQPKILPFTVRRITALGTPEALAGVVDALRDTNEAAARKTILTALNLALKGRTSAPMPPSWPNVYPTLATDPDPEVGSLAQALGLTFGDESIRATLRATLAATGGATAGRSLAMDALRKARDPQVVPILRGLITDPTLGATAIRDLAAFDDPATPPALLDAYPNLATEAKRDALNTLAARPTFALALLDAVGSGRVARNELTADLIRQLRNLKTPEVNTRIERDWGLARESTADRARLIAQAKGKWSGLATQAPDPKLGRAVFDKVCAQCHNLFGAGGNVGPELTGSNRADLDYLLGNIYDPSALIGKDYQATILATADGRVLTGIIRAEDRDAITLATANETLTLPKTQVEDRRLSDLSMMPEGLWDNLADHEVRSLIAYLAGKTQVAPPPGPALGSASPPR